MPPIAPIPVVLPLKAGRNLAPIPNGNNSLSPPERGEGWGEGI
jgi:hypothetical protein